MTRVALRFVPQVRNVLRATAAVCLLLATNCGGAVTTTTYELECETGTLGCSCYGNWSCNYQLSCVEDMCVDRRERPAKNDNALEQAESLPDPLADATSDACLQCLQEDCSTQLEACYPETGCVALQACLLECSKPANSTAAECATQCSNRAPEGARLKSRPVTECSQQNCAACQVASSN